MHNRLIFSRCQNLLNIIRMVLGMEFTEDDVKEKQPRFDNNEINAENIRSLLEISTDNLRKSFDKNGIPFDIKLTETKKNDDNIIFDINVSICGKHTFCIPRKISFEVENNTCLKINGQGSASANELFIRYVTDNGKLQYRFETNSSLSEFFEREIFDKIDISVIDEILECYLMKKIKELK